MLTLIAQKIENPQLIDSVRNLTSEGYINRLIPALINILFIVSIVAFMLLLLIGGTQWILSGGNKQSLENARNKIINAITGLLILLLLWIIIKMVNSVFGINLGNVGVSSSGGTESLTCASHCQDIGISYYYCAGTGDTIPYSCFNDSSTDCDSSRDCYCCSVPPGESTCASYCQGYPDYYCGQLGETVPSYCFNDGQTDCDSSRDCYCCTQVYNTPTPILVTSTPASPTATPTGVPGNYNLTLVPVCANGNIPNIITRATWISWSGTDTVTGEADYGTGSRYISLPVPYAHLYVGLQNYDSLIIDPSSSNNLKPLDPLPSGWGSIVAYGAWYVWTEDPLPPPSGSYTFGFEVPEIYCMGYPITPTPIQVDQWILTSNANTTCSQVCSAAGLQCVMMDFDPETWGGENQYYAYPFICKVLSGDCDTSLTDGLTDCLELETDWTYCGCVSSP